ATITRSANTTAYTANDVYGNGSGGNAFELTNIGPSGALNKYTAKAPMPDGSAVILKMISKLLKKTNPPLGPILVSSNAFPPEPFP
ncbi:MAG: hypothetical protein ACKPEQ_27170, partial [Dolichospermum sp.]